MVDVDVSTIGQNVGVSTIAQNVGVSTNERNVGASTIEQNVGASPIALVDSEQSPMREQKTSYWSYGNDVPRET